MRPSSRLAPLGWRRWCAAPNLTPRGIIDSLESRRPIYRQTAAYGHFGRSEPEFSWERVDQAERLAMFNV